MDLSWLSSLSVYTRISIWATIIPMAFATLTFRRHASSGWMFTLLAAGIVTELSTQFVGPGTSFSENAFLLYSVFEASLLFAIVKNAFLVSLKNFVRALILFSCPLLIASYILADNFSWTIAVFNMAYQVILSFMAGASALKLGEKSSADHWRPEFWLLLGIFFYCFTTFFLMGMIGLTAAHRIWDPFHNTINITTYLIYAFSFWRAFRMERTTSDSASIS